MLLQVYSTCLDPQKGWYVLNSDICGSEVRKFSDNFFFRRFPDKIHKVSFRKLHDESGNALDPNLFGVKYQKCSVVVASTLGLCGALLRQRELNDQSYLSSDSFKRIAAAINNHCAITGLPRNGTSSTVTALQRNLRKQRGRSGISKVLLPTRVLHPTFLRTKNRLRHQNKRKQGLAKSTGKVLHSMEDVCSRYKASVASVLGHLCTHDPQQQPSEARDIISEIVTSVTVKKGVKRGLQTLVPDVLQQFMQQFRVPDWVLLYFKLEAKVLDEGWQTMINLTKLGRTGVS